MDKTLMVMTKFSQAVGFEALYADVEACSLVVSACSGFFGSELLFRFFSTATGNFSWCVLSQSPNVHSREA